MRNDKLTQRIAHDFSAYLTDVVGLDASPPDEFFDPIAKVIGSCPTEAKLVKIYRSKSASSKLAAELNAWLETDAISPETANRMLEFSITNNFGADSL